MICYHIFDFYSSKLCDRQLKHPLSPAEPHPAVERSCCIVQAVWEDSGSAQDKSWKWSMATPSYFRTEPPADLILKEFHLSFPERPSEALKIPGSALSRKNGEGLRRHYVTKRSAEMSAGKEPLCFCSHWVVPGGPIHSYSSRNKDERSCSFCIKRWNHRLGLKPAGKGLNRRANESRK